MQDEISIGIDTKVVNVLRDKGVTDKWKSINSFVKSENEKIKLAAVGIFGTKNEQVVTDLKTRTRDRVVKIFEDETLKVDELLIDRLINI